MRAAWYERRGAAAEVFVVSEMPAPHPGLGEVRVRVHASGINPGDVKKRAPWLGMPIAHPRIIPHSDGAGVIDAVGEGVDASRVGERVWCFGAQSYRPWGTAAEFTSVPSEQAVSLPDGIDYVQGACFGIPGITAHRAVFADGPVDGASVLVRGALGAVGRAAAVLAVCGGAHVVATVRSEDEVETAKRETGAHDVLVQSAADFTQRVLDLTDGRGVDRIIEVAFDANLSSNHDVIALGGVIAAYATAEAEPKIPFWPLLFKNVTIRLLGSDDFPRAAKLEAARAVSEAAADLVYPIAARFPLEEIARAHEAVERGARGRVVLDVSP
ncbi:NADPH:quinone reductase [Pendulispora rubella]|uniref:NADPH:quinone reductase n=1 Tax=Pendulispora rubella TaxID=2741070 RepID=A0ABZ2KZW9_9BACT